MGDSVFAPPEGFSVHQALYSIFTHYCKALKSAQRPVKDGQKEPELTMDGKSFAKLCTEAPDLGKYIGRTDVDLIFSKSKPLGVRRLDYENFLSAILHLSTRIYAEEEPTKAMTYVLANFIFGVFDQESSLNAEVVIEKIYNELNLQ
jgi:hypothetical protein